MLFNVIVDFKDGRTCYYAGERVHADSFEPGTLGRAIDAGWIAEQGAYAVPLAINSESTIDVHDADHRHSAPEVN